jgi:hypothetical protein
MVEISSSGRYGPGFVLFATIGEFVGHLNGGELVQWIPEGFVRGFGDVSFVINSLVRCSVCFCSRWSVLLAR